MNDEIKEILDDIKDILSNKEVYDVEIDKEVLSLLLDYLTNLQQKYEEADYDRHKLFEEIEILNNNWNELEEYLNEQIQRSWEIEEQCYETVLDKMKEIKEGK